MLTSIVTGTVVGVVIAVIGAIGNYIATTRRDEQQRAHEEKTRYQPDRLSAYARFFRTTQIGFTVHFSNPPTEDQVKVLSDGYAETLILSTEPVQDAAIQLYIAHIRAIGITTDEENFTEEELRTDPHVLATQRRDAFLDAVRKELNITLPAP